MSDVTLEPFEWVELDQDYCQVAQYGVAPCTASLASGGAECFHTRASCQDPAHYDRGTLTLRFCMSQAFLPDDAHYIPSLKSVRTDAGSINPVGASSNSTALGTRAGISVEFQDHPHTDKLVDPYVANRRARDPSYIATERGTFWTKWRARNPYYLGRQIRYNTGFIDPVTRELVNVVTRTYFITAFEGPTADGRVSIAGRDLLSQVSNEKAKAPFVSTGKLLNDITAVQTSLQLDPVGIGDEEYDLSGVIRIGNEVMTYTRLPTSDTLTIVRGRRNTEAKEAKAGDVVQKCLDIVAQRPADILELFMVDYAATPTVHLDLAQWDQENTDFLPRLYSTLITSPTGITDLIAGMCQEMYFYPVWDERTAKLKIRAIRPAQDEPVTDLDDFANLLEGSVQLRDLPEQLITQVWVYYGILNPTGNLTDDNNYAAREIVATDEGLPEKQGIEKIRKIYCRWIPSTNGAAAIDLGEKYLARYGAAPRQASFSLGEKDASLWLGDFVKLHNRMAVDMTGAPLALNLQVMSAQQSRAGVLFNYICQEFVYEKPLDPTNRVIIIAADQMNVNLREVHDSLYTPPVGGETINVVIRSGVVIGSRGNEPGEQYTGTVRFEVGGTVSTRSRTLHPLMSRELGFSNTSTGGMRLRGSQVAVDTNGVIVGDYTPGSFMYAMQSDMRQRPCSFAFDTGTWPPGVTLNVLQESGSYVAGQGGFSSHHTAMGGGGSFGVLGRGGLLFASDGGHALRIRHPVNWTNYGTIAGGAGGGYPGLVNCTLSNYTTIYMWVSHESGGGAGRFSAAVANHESGTADVVKRLASAGDVVDGGYGSIVQTTSLSLYILSYAGDGGDLALPGTQGSYSKSSPYGGMTKHGVRLSGGRPGNAVIEGADLITWINKGDVRGAEAI